MKIKKKTQVFAAGTWQVEECVENIETRVVQLHELVGVEFRNLNSEADSYMNFMSHLSGAV